MTDNALASEIAAIQIGAQKNHLTLVVNNGSITARDKNSNTSGNHAPKVKRDFLYLNEYGLAVNHGGSVTDTIPSNGEEVRLTGFKFLAPATKRVTKSLIGGDVNHLSVEAFMTTITILDLNTEVNHEPRILDVRLAESLGFSQSRQIRPLIERHKKALEKLGGVCRTVRQTKGRPANEYYLNKMQALYICTKSETEKATEITLEVVRVYDAFTSGTLNLPQPSLSGFTFTHEEMEIISNALLESFNALGDFIILMNTRKQMANVVDAPLMHDALVNKYVQRLSSYSKAVESLLKGIKCIPDSKTTGRAA